MIFRHLHYILVMLVSLSCTETGLSEFDPDANFGGPSPWDDVDEREIPRLAWPMVLYETNINWPYASDYLGTTETLSCDSPIYRLLWSSPTNEDLNFTVAFVDPLGRVLSRHPTPPGSYMPRELNSDASGRVLLKTRVYDPELNKAENVIWLFDWRVEDWEPLLAVSPREPWLSNPPTFDLSLAPDLPVNDDVSSISLSFHPEDPDRFFVVIRQFYGMEGDEFIQNLCIVHRPTGTTERCASTDELVSSVEDLGYTFPFMNYRTSPAVTFGDRTGVPFLLGRQSSNEAVMGLWTDDMRLGLVVEDVGRFDRNFVIGDGERLGVANLFRGAPGWHAAFIHLLQPNGGDVSHERDLQGFPMDSFRQTRRGKVSQPRCMHVASLVDADAPTVLLQLDMVHDVEGTTPPGYSRFVIMHRGEPVIDVNSLTEGLGQAVGPRGRPMFIRSISSTPVAY